MQPAPISNMPELYRYRVLSSTQDTARRLAADGAPEGTAVLADVQTAGYGQQGRLFRSPQSGLYLSMILRPDCLPQEAAIITPAAALAASDAVRSCCGIELQIKWINDLMLCGRKAGGILTETSVGADGRIAWAVTGFGINLRVPDGGFAPEIADTAAALLSGCGPEKLGTLRDSLADGIILRMRSYAQMLRTGADFDGAARESAGGIRKKIWNEYRRRLVSDEQIREYLTLKKNGRREYLPATENL